MLESWKQYCIIEMLAHLNSGRRTFEHLSLTGIKCKIGYCCFHYVMYITGWPNKNRTFWDTMFFLQMWTDFQKSFTRWFVRIFYMYTSQRFPPHLQYVAMLPCEIQKSKKWLWQHLNRLDVFLWALWGLDLTFNSS